jgi:uncharacterized membrane protein YhaH (DUF805 family)
MAAQIRRWHDMGHSGFWTLLNFIPCVGSLFCLTYLGFFKGTQGVNRYGPPAGPRRNER